MKSEASKPRLTASGRWIFVLLVIGAAVVLTAALNPFAQPPGYHDFADARQMFGIPRAFDVLSNLPFVFVGIIGLYLCLAKRPQQFDAEVVLAYVTLFAGLLLTGFGSGYYHLAPDNQRLVWDRLPMTLVMVGFFSVVLLDRVTTAAAAWCLPLLSLLGLGSVLQWWWSESRGHGDLRWYLLFQSLVILVGLLLLVLFPTVKIEGTRALVIAVGANIAAKVFEMLDKPIYHVGGMVSGHTLKHLSAGLGFVPLLFWLAAQSQHQRVRTEATVSR